MESIGLCLSDPLCRVAVKIGLAGALVLVAAALVIAVSTGWLLRQQSRRQARLGWEARAPRRDQRAGAAVPQPIAPEQAGAHTIRRAGHADALQEVRRAA